MFQVMCEEGIRTNTMEQGLQPVVKQRFGLTCGDEDKTSESGVEPMDLTGDYDNDAAGGGGERSNQDLETKANSLSRDADETPGKEKPVQRIDHTYIERLMWNCPYYKEGVEINPDMFNDQNTPDRAEISAVRSWLRERGMLCPLIF